MKKVLLLLIIVFCLTPVMSQAYDFTIQEEYEIIAEQLVNPDTGLVLGPALNLTEFKRIGRQHSKQ